MEKKRIALLTVILVILIANLTINVIQSNIPVNGFCIRKLNLSFLEDYKNYKFHNFKWIVWNRNSIACFSVDGQRIWQKKTHAEIFNVYPTNRYIFVSLSEPEWKMVAYDYYGKNIGEFKEREMFPVWAFCTQNHTYILFYRLYEGHEINYSKRYTAFVYVYDSKNELVIQKVLPDRLYMNKNFLNYDIMLAETKEFSYIYMEFWNDLDLIHRLYKFSLRETYEPLKIIKFSWINKMVSDGEYVYLSSGMKLIKLCNESISWVLRLPDGTNKIYIYKGKIYTFSAGRIFVINREGRYEKISEFTSLHSFYVMGNNGKSIVMTAMKNETRIRLYDKNLNRVWTLDITQLSVFPQCSYEESYSEKILNTFGYICYDYRNDRVGVYYLENFYLVENVLPGEHRAFVEHPYIISYVITYIVAGAILVIFILYILTKKIRMTLRMLTAIIFAVMGMFFGPLFCAVAPLTLFTFHSNSRYIKFVYPSSFILPLLLYIYRFKFVMYATTIISMVISLILLLVYPILLKQYSDCKC